MVRVPGDAAAARRQPPMARDLLRAGRGRLGARGALSQGGGGAAGTGRCARGGEPATGENGRPRMRVNASEFGYRAVTGTLIVIGFVLCAMITWIVAKGIAWFVMAVWGAL